MKWQWAWLILFSFLSITACEKKSIHGPVPLIYGHAGMALSEERAIFPPNSQASVLYALDALNADGVEVDVQLTADSVLVLHHDSDFDDEEDECIPEITWNRLKELEKDKKHEVIRLSALLELNKPRQKHLYLDLKHFNDCAEGYVDFSAFNWALENEWKSLSTTDKEKITVNSRTLDLLNAITDTVVVKAFETEDIDKAIIAFDANQVDKLTIKLDALTAANSEKLEDAGMPYTIFGIKTKDEINETKSYREDALITDNIATTRKKLK